MTDQAFETYRVEVERTLRAGNATEHSYRPALKILIENLATSIDATNEPKRSACGAPDYIVSLVTAHGPLTIGHIEAKDVDVSLDQEERSPQLRRYRAALENLILTDYVEFRWYVDGQRRATARLGTPDSRGRLSFTNESIQKVKAILQDFLSHRAEPVKQPKELAERMARITHIIRDLIITTFEVGVESRHMRDLRSAFQDVLIPELSVKDFADMFAQTLAYGLFAARVYHDDSKGPFQRLSAILEIPRANPFLRQLFAAITGPDLEDEPFASFVTDLTQLLADSDMASILAHFGRRTRQEDPIVHFYETFLTAYDPRLRELRGVYFTPEPVVSYIVRSVDSLLKTRFGCADGFADTSTVSPHRTSAGEGSPTLTMPRVLVLDPACGTGTFLYAVIELVRDLFRQRGNAGRWPTYVHEQLLPRLFGFELLMAPYAVAHLKLALQLAGMDLPPSDRANWSYDFQNRERLGIYLTNSLEPALKKSALLLGSYISQEANAAAEIKQDLPIMVVLGNPPYSGHSANKGDWIRGLVDDYKRGCPDLNRPAQAKWLQDDYVKFLRLGQWRIDQTGSGILAFVTNHAYLSNPTFRCMRRDLMSSFTDIYILDLHGNERRHEKSPDGRPDHNVFDIQQGVAISIFIKDPSKSPPASVYHSERWGDRNTKYDWLKGHDVSSTTWNPLDPDEPQYLFHPVDAVVKAEFDKYWSLPDIFNQGGSPAPGIVTTQDEFAISWNQNDAESKVIRFLRTSSEEEARRIWRLCSQSQWNYQRAKAALSVNAWRDDIYPIMYRPFDMRWTVYNPHVAVHRRERSMRHMLAGDNLAIIYARSNKSPIADHFCCSKYIVETKCGESTTQSYTTPLYLYPSHMIDEGGQLELLGDITADPESQRSANINPEVITLIASYTGFKFLTSGHGDLDETFGPEDIFCYIYSLLYSNGYRTRYANFLKTEFPRVPFTSDKGLFVELVSRGKTLVALHLLESSSVNRPITRFPVRGSNVVEPGYPKYVASVSPSGSSDGLSSDGRLYINGDEPKAGKAGQYFDGVPADVWGFTIGGYQVLDRWLTYRRGRALTDSDLSHFERMVTSLRETIDVVADIDRLVPGWPLS